ncbi:hypothetical protein [Enterococcus sp.]|uniref:hypothetical protein n=1 Tax=Enterococcus sp. TaxID=35783 RepID=UPI0028A936C4|nr:hypothetical protein [Enterococcus sp.]
MNKFQVLNIVLLNLFTVTLIDIFVLINEKGELLLTIIILITVNSSISSLVILANKKVLQVRYLVGMSRKEITYHFYLIDGLSLSASIVIVSGFSYIFNKQYAFNYYLIFVVIILFFLKSIIMRVMVGRIL